MIPVHAASMTKLLDLGTQHDSLRGELMQVLERALDSQQFILGPEVERFETAVASTLGIKHALGVSSGSDALLAALMALDVGPGDEVITTTFSFFATVGCIARLGATAVLTDVDAVTLNITAEAVAAAITPRTKAIIPVHLFGLMADMTGIMHVAEAHGIPVIEDACQAIGSTCDGRPAGGIGLAGCFSFFPSKNLGALGDAGLLTTNDDAFAQRLRMLRTHGSRKKYHHEIVGGNFRIDALQAGFLGVKLPHLDRWNSARRANARKYGELFHAAGLDQVTLPAEAAGCTHTYHQYVIRCSDRDGLRAHLANEGIGTEVYYPGPLHLQPCFADLGYGQGSLPVAERACLEVIALPIYPELETATQERVVGAVADFFGG